MCDHVIEYIEADRAERRLMLETLDAARAASSPTVRPRSRRFRAALARRTRSPAAAAPSEIVANRRRASPGVHHATGGRPSDEFFAFAPGERVHRRFDAGRTRTDHRPRRAGTRTEPDPEPVARDLERGVRPSSRTGDAAVGDDRDRGRGARPVRRPLGRRLRDLRGHDDPGRARATGCGASATAWCSRSCSTRRTSATSRRSNSSARRTARTRPARAGSTAQRERRNGNGSNGIRRQRLGVLVAFLSTRSEPVVDTGSKPSATARCHT